VAARFIGNSEIGASTAPFFAMRCDPATACARLRQQVSEFVAQGAIGLRFTMFAKPAVEQHASVSALGATCRRTEASRPFDTHLGGDLGCALPKQQLAREGFKHRIATGEFCGNGN